MLYRNHITLLAKQFNRRNALFSRGLWQFGRGVLDCNLAGQGCYRETIYSLLGSMHDDFDDKGAHKWLYRLSNMLERDTSGEKQEHKTVSKVFYRAPPRM